MLASAAAVSEATAAPAGNAAGRSVPRWSPSCSLHCSLELAAQWHMPAATWHFVSCACTCACLRRAAARSAGELNAQPANSSACRTWHSMPAGLPVLTSTLLASGSRIEQRSRWRSVRSRVLSAKFTLTRPSAYAVKQPSSGRSCCSTTSLLSTSASVSAQGTCWSLGLTSGGWRSAQALEACLHQQQRDKF